VRAHRRTLAETHIHETLRGSLFDPAYGAQSLRTPSRVAIGEALDALLQTRPPIATLEALDELIDALHRRTLEVRAGEREDEEPGGAP
jgi:hypothetical protein